MSELIKYIRRTVGVLADLQAVWTFILPALLAALSGYDGYMRDGFAWGLFIAAGVFAFLTVAWVIIRESYRANRLEHKLGVSGIGMVQQPSGTDGFSLFRPIVTLQSSASFEIQFELTRADFDFAGIKTGLSITGLKGVIAPRDLTNLVIPPATGYPPLQPGKCLIEVKYGRAGETLTHQLTTRLECSATHSSPQTQEPVDLMMVRNIDTLSYSRVKA